MYLLNHYQLTADACGPQNNRSISIEIDLPKGSRILSIYDTQLIGFTNIFHISVLESNAKLTDKYKILIIPVKNVSRKKINNNAIFLGTMQNMSNNYYDFFYEIIS